MQNQRKGLKFGHIFCPYPKPKACNINAATCSVRRVYLFPDSLSLTVQGNANTIFGHVCFVSFTIDKVPAYRV